SARRSSSGAPVSPTTAGRRVALALQRRRVLPLGRARRRDEPAAQPLARRGRGRGRRRLPPDGVPRAPRPFRLLRLLRAGRRLRLAAGRVPRAGSRLGPPARGGGGPLAGLARTRLGALRVAPRRAAAPAGREPRGRL